MPVPHYYAVVTDKLLPSEEKWVGMKTVGRLRHELGLTAHQKQDSYYKVKEHARELSSRRVTRIRLVGILEDRECPGCSGW